MQGASTTDHPASSLQYQCGSVDFLCSPRLGKKATPSRPCHGRPVAKPRPQPQTTTISKAPAAQKPQVPPKPPHLLALGQDKKPKRIPPAPSRPLPAPPPPPKPKPSQTHPVLGIQKEAQKVGLLIERFENSRVPIIGVPGRNQLHLCLSMDATSEATPPSGPDPSTHAPSEPAGAKDPGERSPADKLPLSSSKQTDEVTEVTELSRLALLRIDGPDDGALDHCTEGNIHNHAVGSHGNAEQEDGSSYELQDNQDLHSTEQNGKIPNRDSGIDSPSCTVEGEVFPNEDAIDEEDRYDSVTETESVSCVTLGNKRDSTQDEDSDLDEGSSGEADGGDKADTLTEASKCSESQKLLNIARELLHTEEAYVKRLNLLDQVFCTKLTEAGIPQDVITGIFSNISSIYCFHDKFLLPDLKTRIIGEWDSKPRIGDILQKLAPFMKMYGEYVKNFDRAMDLVNTWTQRSSQFKSVVQNIQKQDVCGNLTLQHHMLEPVQRIPRYELLLKDYLKKLPEDALDRKDAEKAVELISTAANHSNAAIKKMEKMHKLLEVYERLGGEEDIVNPANELIKEGHIKKMSAKNGTAQDRYLYLFNNMLLYCVPKLRLMGQKFSVRERIDIAGMEVQGIAKQNLPHTFAIIGKQRSLELQARAAEEKEDWIQVILATIERHKQNSETFNKAFNSSFSREEDHPPDSPGPWINASIDSDSERLHERKSSKKKEKEKTTCKGCNESFNFTKRKHHCKSCGAAICAKCSKTLENKTCRLCPECFEASQGLEGLAAPPAEHKRKAAAERQVSLTGDNFLLCSYLQVQEKGKSWTKTWVAVSKTEPLVLYLQSNGQDSRGARAVPLPGFEVSTAPLPATEKSELKHTFRLSHTQQALLFGAQDAELQAKWVEVLSRAARGEMPTDASVSLTENRKSQ
ncbi:faciogenital dysplasia isoform X1 [Osmerus eperlanus]|uniref:faciogenital dysplasia isoform X1 n=1 Tax=Osmerus eperlanus TaxID=29151 RepID=UPI002E15932D